MLTDTSLEKNLGRSKNFLADLIFISNVFQLAAQARDDTPYQHVAIMNRRR